MFTNRYSFFLRSDQVRGRWIQFIAIIQIHILIYLYDHLFVLYFFIIIQHISLNEQDILIHFMC